MGTIMVLEDDDSVNRGITFMLEKEGYEVYSCGTVAEADRQYSASMPELLICDITLPDGNGLDFIRRIRQRGNTYVICLTALDTETDYVMGYGAGADDYVAKPFSLSVLVWKVRAFFQRSRREEPEIVRTGELTVHLREHRLWRGGQELSLTANEWRLLSLFIDHPGQILTKKQLLERLFDIEGDFVEENTIAVNIRRLREKIEPDISNPDYVRNVRGVGYVWSKECGRK